MGGVSSNRVEESDEYISTAEEDRVLYPSLQVTTNSFMTIVLYCNLYSIQIYNNIDEH